MKNYVTRVAAVLLICAVAAAAFAERKNGTVTFDEDVVVNGTVVKKGDYRVKFDKQTGELTLTKAGAPVAKTKARLEKRDKKARATRLGIVEKEKVKVLQSIILGGDDQAIILGEGSGQAASTNN